MQVYTMQVKYVPDVEIDAEVITNPAVIVPVLRAKMMENPDQEQFWVVCLDGANQVKALKMVTLGLVDQAQVHARECFKPAVLCSAVSIIIAHNHPSGQLQASPEDQAVTKRLSKAGGLLGIPVLDHIIITETGWKSIRSESPTLFIYEEA